MGKMSFPALKQNLQFLAIQHQVLLKMGIDLNAMAGKDMLQNYWKFIPFLSVTLYVEYALLNFGISNDIDMATGALAMFNQGLLILWKIAIFLYEGDGYMKSIWEINNLAEKANPKENKKWVSENRLSQILAKTHYSICWTAVVCAGLIPIAIMAYEHYNGNEVKQRYPFDGKFPFDHGGLWWLFSLNYTLSMVYIYALLNMTVGFDTLFGWYIFSVSAHFRILRNKLEILSLKLDREECGDFAKEIGAIVWYHNKTLKFVKDLNKIFENILWVEVMLSCLQICFNIYTLNNDSDISKMPFQCMVLVAVTMQLIIYCFGGEKIKHESDMLCMDFYMQFPWQKMSVQQKKLMLFPLMRSQRQCPLSGAFFEVDRNLLVYIFKTAFSFNTLLSAMKE